MSEEEYAELFNRIRPEIIELAQKNQQYWMEKYSPLIGDIQNFIYDLYLKGNKIQSGRKNYSEVIGLLISYEEWKKTKFQIMHTRKEQMEAFGRFLDILDELREKCPWDRKQTNESLRPNTIEETYELCDALIRDDKNDICKELG